MGLFKTKDIERLNDGPDQIITDIEFLRTPSVATDLKHIQEIKFVERCKEALPHAWTAGFGLAAVQIGIPIRAAWYAMKCGKETKERLIWNPKIITAQYPFDFQKEGCLSIPGMFLETTRFQHVKIMNGDGETFEADGIEAVIVQHEIDHMDGILCIDRKKTARPEVGRNDPCYCGSGKKFKKCCFVEPKVRP